MYNLRACAVPFILALSACSDGSPNGGAPNNSVASVETNSSSSAMDSSPVIEQSNIEGTANQTATNQTDTNSIAHDANVIINLPPGCIGDIDTAGNTYCVYPDDRLFIASLTDGTTWWSFTLPGENESNEIEAVVVVGNEIVLVADKAPMLDANVNEKYEISRFEQNGAFIETQSVSLYPKSDSNLCQDAWCAYYNNSSILPYPNHAAEKIIAQKAVTPSGELGLLLGWSRYHSKEYDISANRVITIFEGGVISLLAIHNAQTIAEHLYSGERVVKLGPQVNGKITVTTDQRESQLDSTLHSTNQPENSVSGFNDKPVVQWLSDWNSVIAANPLRNLDAEIDNFETIQGWLNGSAVDGVIDADSIFGENAINKANLDASESTTDDGYSEGIVESNCATAGTVTITSQALSPPQQIGGGTTVTRNRHYRFNQCAFDIHEQALEGSTLALSDAGSYLLNGDFLSHSKNSTNRSGSSDQFESYAKLFEATYPTGAAVKISGVNKNNEIRDARNFSQNSSMANEISYYSKTINGIETTRRRDFSRKASLNSSNILVSWSAEVQGEVFDIYLGENEISIQTIQPFYRVNNNAVSNKSFDNFEGEIALSTSSGDQILLQPVSDQTLPFTREWILITGQRDGLSNSTTIPLQSLYAPVSIEASQ